jgi:predicted Zn-dependent peptidase
VVRGWIQKYFGPIRRGAESEPLPGPRVPTLPGPKHISLVDQTSHAVARLVWPTVPAGNPNEPALDILASILGGLDINSRLSRSLIFGKDFAALVGAMHPTYLMSGEFQVDLYAEAGRQFADLVRIADEEIERLKTEGPTEVEVRRAQHERERSLILGLESVGGKAAVLCQGAAAAGDPRAYQAAIEKILAVTPEGVARVARQYLGPFAESDLERLVHRRAAGLKVGENDTRRIADEVFPRLIYPREHRYGRPFLGTNESVASISRADVVAFYKKTFVPGNAELVVVGDIHVDDIVALLAAKLRSWPAGGAPSPPRLSQPPRSANGTLYLIDRPGTTQSTITVGRVGFSGEADDYQALSAPVASKPALAGPPDGSAKTSNEEQD